VAERDDGLNVGFRIFEGIIGDIKRRKPNYWDDYKNGFHPKVLASILFLFFACLANAVAFGGLTGMVTGNAIGTVEMIVATAAGGIVFAIFSGQPLTILGGTGPIVIFTGLLYTTCQSMEIDFLATYAWVGLWSGLFLVFLALFNVSVLMRYFTRFTDEIFAALIAVIFIVEACKNMFTPMMAEKVNSPLALLTMMLALGTYLLSRNMKSFSRTPYMSRGIRNFISDFGPAIAIGAMTLFALQFPDIKLEVPAIPEKLTTTTGRPWLVDIFAVPTWVIFASIVPAIMATILLFLDQNITTRLVNAPGNKLKKGAGFHLDLLVVGLITGVCSIFGLPWIVAATVHAINHVKSLADMKVVDSGNQNKEVIDTVRENRISPLMIHVLIAGSIFILPIIKLIPMAVLFGLFLFMGFATLSGNQFWERIMLWFTDKKLYPETHYIKLVSMSTMHKVTLVQLLGLSALWILKSSAIGILFPVLIAMLVPLRLYLNKILPKEELDILDAEEEEDFDDADMDFHA
jgi:hypothetical protein